MKFERGEFAKITTLYDPIPNRYPMAGFRAGDIVMVTDGNLPLYVPVEQYTALTLTGLQSDQSREVEVPSYQITALTGMNIGYAPEVFLIKHPVFGIDSQELSLLKLNLLESHPHLFKQLVLEGKITVDSGDASVVKDTAHSILKLKSEAGEEETEEKEKEEDEDRALRELRRRLIPQETYSTTAEELSIEDWDEEYEPTPMQHTYYSTSVDTQGRRTTITENGTWLSVDPQEQEPTQEGDEE